jgi:copper homeostasis protein
VLTSGGKATAIEGKENILQMTKAANGCIEIMAGSGVNASNVAALKAANVDALHFSIRKKIGEPLPLGMGINYESDENKIKSIIQLL